MSLGNALRAGLAAKSKPRAWRLRPEVLLCPQIPKPLHGVAPRVILGEAWWDETRQAAYASTDYHCVACGVAKHSALFHQWLEGHELYKTEWERGRLIYLETVPLCHTCHNFIHLGRLQMLLDKGEVTQEKYDQIVAHGNVVLKAAKLTKKPVKVKGPLPGWPDWRLVIDGKEYPPKFKSFKEWQEAYA